MHRAALHSLRQVICSSPIPHSPRPSRIFPARNRVFASIAAPHPEPPALELIAVTPLATELLAHYFASSLQPGDSYLLYGEVGSGKSYFSRSFIRASLGDESAHVPSPTFLLQNTYPLPLPPHTNTNTDNPPSLSILHVDLYRLTPPHHDLHRLDLHTSLPQTVSLIEWAERLGEEWAPREHTALRLGIVGDAERQALLDKHDFASTVVNKQIEEEEEEDTDDVRWRRIEIWSRGRRSVERVERLKSKLAKHQGQTQDLGLILATSCIE